jgi:polyphosphate kinase 2 (PPK2 family)
VDFERTIADDGHLIIKYFLHISKDEQKSRFEKLIKDPLMAWHVEPEDWDHHKKYAQWALAYEEMFERTDTEWGSWTIVEATNRYHTRIKIFQTIINALEKKLGISTEKPVQQKEADDHISSSITEELVDEMKIISTDLITEEVK